MENQNEILFKLKIFEQQMQQLQQQMQAVEHGILELSILNSGLDELVNSNGKEILAPVGRGIFAKAKIISEDLTVDIGGKNLVKKSIPETKDTIKEQIKKLESVKKELEKNAVEIGKEAESIFNEIQK